LSVGVASIADYRQLIDHLPAFITKERGGAGFHEGVNRLLALR